MLLQLILIHYHDGPKCVKRFLDSVELQQNINFGEISVLIENDGNDVILDKEMFNGYSFHIDYFVEEWSGISGVRQHGFDRATADYVMFCDGDDLFYRNNALWNILRVIKSDHPDIITSQFATDMCNQFGFCDYFKFYNNENVWIHGKVFRKNFLIDNNIKWNKSLLLYEDSYFVRLCFAMNPTKINIDETLYFWKFRQGSITRSEASWLDDTYVDKMFSSSELVKNFLGRGMLTEAANFAFAQIYEVYFTLLEERWKNPEYAERKDKIERAFKTYWSELGWLLPKVLPEAAQVMMEVLRERFYTTPKRLSLEPITFEDWKNSILDKQ